MTTLYTELAYLYDALYQSFIDYDQEFALYTNLMRPYGATSVIEIGCGSGHLARRFNEAGWNYLGVDNSESMLTLARQRCPTARFRLGDMRTLAVEQPVDAVLITARSLSYIIHNQDVLSTFRHLAQCLTEGGKLIFDFIDAQSFFRQLDESVWITHRATYEAVNYLRRSRYVPNLTTGMTWDWHSAFFTEPADGNPQPLATDLATLRAFLTDEMALFLQFSGFSVLRVLPQPTYAFDTFIMVAEKNKPPA